jgi:hypothetical protein
MLTGERERVVSQTGLDAAALKPMECDVRRALDLPFDTVAIDYEGREQLPDTDLLAELAAEKRVLLTTPVRADGFDPLGDDSLYETLPDAVDPVFVAGHPAYLTDAEQSRAIAPRLGAARDIDADAWVGTEGVERVALAAGGPQYELLSRTTERDFRALRAAGFDETIALYAPTVLSDDPDDVLDAVGGYISRRGPVRRALPDDAATDASATGRAREVLLKASRDFALVGSLEEVGERVRTLKSAGADVVVGYPARGVDEFTG